MPSKNKKNYTRIFLTGLFIFLIAGTLAIVLYQYFFYVKPKFIHYKEFGINIPVGYEIHGIDVARYQKLISWKDVKDMEVDGVKLGFAFIKATEGANYLDPNFKRNWKKSREAAIPRGAYHFFNPAKDGRLQASQFIKYVELQPGDLPPVLDIETTGNVPYATIRKEALEWLQIIEEYYGVTPLLYTNVDYYKNVLSSDFDAYPLWVAHYYQPEQPRISRSWIFWQHNDKGRVSGIDAPVDFNVFSGDSTDFQSMLVQ